MGLLALLAGCARETPHDVAFYRADPQARSQELATCRNDRGRLAATSNCINALAADSDSASHHFWTASQPASRVRNPGHL